MNETLYFYLPLVPLLAIELIINRRAEYVVYEKKETAATLFLIGLKIVPFFFVPQVISNQLFYYVNVFSCHPYIAGFYINNKLFNGVTLPFYLKFFCLFIFTDFAYYVWHRMNHKINILWASHFTHHSFKKMSLLAGLRTPYDLFTVFVLTSWIFFLPLLFGYTVYEVWTCICIQQAYGAITHTNLNVSYGFMEHVLVSPQHHRLHHCIRPQAKTVNFGSFFIIWDKIFGTFEKEISSQQYEYGVAGFHSGGDFFKINFSIYGSILKNIRNCKSFKDLFKALFF